MPSISGLRRSYMGTASKVAKGRLKIREWKMRK